MYKVSFLLKRWEQSRAITATHWKGSSWSKTKVYAGLLFVNQQQSSYTLEMSWEFSRKKKKHQIRLQDWQQEKDPIFLALSQPKCHCLWNSRNGIKALGRFWNWWRKAPSSISLTILNFPWRPTLRYDLIWRN